MTTAELLRTLASTKSALALEAARNPMPPLTPMVERVEVDWEARAVVKNKFFLRYFLIMIGIFAVSMFTVATPLVLTCPSFGKSYMMGIPPMFLMALSWMASAWWAWDKDRFMFFAVTMGGIPVRLGLGLLWMVLAMNVPEIKTDLVTFSMMLHWVLFSVVEFVMLHKMSNALPDKKEMES